MNAYTLIEETVRDAYGRLLSYLIVNWQDVEAVEDALSDALLAALEAWPDEGIPSKPESWLLAVAKRKLIDRARRARVSERALPALVALSEEVRQLTSANLPFPDERLKMLFLCAHPAIDPSIRTPLMLQIVVGMDASRIASAFVVKPATMGQRLTRAKAKIRNERLAFDMPDADQLPLRLDAVLEAIYAMYGSGWDDLTGMDPRRKELAQEALYLGKLLGNSVPDEPEIQGLLALMLHCEARRTARMDAAGNFVPLSEQDPAQWSIPAIEEAEQHLLAAAKSNRIGRFQLLAAIQSVHAQRARTGRIEWHEIALLYEGLARLSPTIGVLVGRAAAAAEGYGAERGMALLESIPRDKIGNYQPYWALAAHLNARLGRRGEARSAYRLAVELCEDPSIRQYLDRQARQI